MIENLKYSLNLVRDGIINFLVKKQRLKMMKNFVEIGVGDYSECNTKFTTSE